MANITITPDQLLKTAAKCNISIDSNLRKFEVYVEIEKIVCYESTVEIWAADRHDAQYMVKEMTASDTFEVASKTMTESNCFDADRETSSCDASEVETTHDERVQMLTALTKNPVFIDPNQMQLNF